MQLWAAQLGSQRQGLQRGRRGLVPLVAAAGHPPSAPGGGRLDGPAARAFLLELEVFGTFSKEARRAAVEDQRRFDAKAQFWRKGLQAKVEAHDRLLRTPAPQQAANAPSATQPLARLDPPAANSSPLPTGNALAADKARTTAEAAAAAAVAFASSATQHEAAAEAAEAASSSQPALSAKAREEWRSAAAAWRSASEALQSAVQAHPELEAVREAAAAVQGACRGERQCKGLVAEAKLPQEGVDEPTFPAHAWPVPASVYPQLSCINHFNVLFACSTPSLCLVYALAA